MTAAAQTVRLRFTKLGKVRFVSHRDTARVWERALRKAGVSVAYSEGFAPRPKLSFGLALPTGHESLGEYLDVDVADALDVEELPARLTPALPVGIDVQGAVEVAPGTPSLQQAVTSCTWRIEVIGPSAARLTDLVAGVLASDTAVVTRERKGRSFVDDVRPLVLSLAVTGQCSGGAELIAELGTQPRGLRTRELLALLATHEPAGLAEGRTCRTHQWMLLGGARREPVPVTGPFAATSAPRAELRAS
jgi:radical SAM-linked protein